MEKFNIERATHLFELLVTIASVCFAIVEEEMNNNWSWFLDLLRRYVIGGRAGLFYIQHLLNTRLILLLMMTTNWFLMYVYRLIIWYEKLKKQQ